MKKKPKIEITRKEHDTIDFIIGLIEDNPMLCNATPDECMEILESLRAKMVRALWKK